MTEHTPTDEDMRKRHRYAWEQCPVNRYALEEADAQWSRWLAAHDARVRRDAAREALDGLAEDVRAEWDREHRWVASAVGAFRDNHYPETEDQT